VRSQHEGGGPVPSLRVLIEGLFAELQGHQGLFCWSQPARRKSCTPQTPVEPHAGKRTGHAAYGTGEKELK